MSNKKTPFAIRVNQPRVLREQFEHDAELLRRHADWMRERKERGLYLNEDQAGLFYKKADAMTEKDPEKLWRQNFAVEPPGFGKGVVIADVVKALYDGKRVFVLTAPNQTLLKKNADVIEERWPEIYHHKLNKKALAYYSGSKKQRITPDTKIIMATPAMKRQLIAKGILVPDVTTVLLPDELHEEMTDNRGGSYEEFFEAESFIFGLTATDAYSETKTVSNAFFNGRPPLHRMPIREAVEKGYTCPFGFSIKDVDAKVNEEKIRREAQEKHPDYGKAQLARIVRLEVAKASMHARIHMDAAHYAADVNPYTGEKVFGKPKFAFFQSIKWAERSVDVYNEMYGEGTAAVYHSEMTQHQRDDIEKRFRKGEIKVLCSVRCLSRGIDIKDLAHLSIVSNTTSALLLIQELGRIFRMNPADLFKFSYALQYVDTKNHPSTVLLTEALESLGVVSKESELGKRKIMGEAIDVSAIKDTEPYPYRVYFTKHDLAAITRLANYRRGNNNFLLPKPPVPEYSLPIFYSLADVIYLLKKTEGAAKDKKTRIHAAKLFEEMERELKASGKPIDEIFTTRMGIQVLFAGTEIGNVLHVNIVQFAKQMGLNERTFGYNSDINTWLMRFYTDVTGDLMYNDHISTHAMGDEKNLFAELEDTGKGSLFHQLCEEYIAAQKGLPEEKKYTQVLVSSHGIRMKLDGDSETDRSNLHINPDDLIAYIKSAYKSRIRHFKPYKYAHDTFGSIERPKIREQAGTGNYVTEDELEGLLDNLMQRLPFGIGARQRNFLMQDLCAFYDRDIAKGLSTTPESTNYGINVAQKLTFKDGSKEVIRREMLVCAGDVAAYCFDRLGARLDELYQKRIVKSDSECLKHERSGNDYCAIKIEDADKFMDYYGIVIEPKSDLARFKGHLRILEAKMLERHYEEHGKGPFRPYDDYVVLRGGTEKDPLDYKFERMFTSVRDYSINREILIEIPCVVKCIDGKPQVYFHADHMCMEATDERTYKGMKFSPEKRMLNRQHQFGEYVSLSRFVELMADEGYEVSEDFLQFFMNQVHVMTRDRIKEHSDTVDQEMPNLFEFSLDNGVQALVDYCLTEDMKILVRDVRAIFNFSQLKESFLNQVKSRLAANENAVVNSVSATNIAMLTVAENKRMDELSGGYDRIVRFKQATGESLTRTSIIKAQEKQMQRKLFEAVKNGDVETIRLIMNTNGNLRTLSYMEDTESGAMSSGTNPITYAIYMNKWDSYYALIAGATVAELERYDGFNETPLHAAVSKAIWYKDYRHDLTAKADPMLEIVTEKAATKIVKDLLARGVNPLQPKQNSDVVAADICFSTRNGVREIKSIALYDILTEAAAGKAARKNARNFNAAKGDSLKFA